ncbi:FecR domain-containing protein [Piscinibacter sp.]|uniref:FecR domain-containing protein n=1 Tax=Piscinibacter sp. TaxID=1903157 RepID=UPI0039E2B3FF
MSGTTSAGAVPALPRDIVEAAIAWAVQLGYNEPTPEARGAFERWLGADPRHALAWQRVDSLQQPFAVVPPALLRATLATAETKREQRSPPGRRQVSKLLALAGVTLGAGWAVREHAPWQRLLADASTTTGEQKTLHLSDGSVIVLNTDSAVSTELGHEHRLVMLRRGEMLVTTGADGGETAKRPFWVHTPFGALRALGTRFTVRLDDRRARISVQDGTVELHPAGGGAAHVLRAGQSRWLHDGGSEPIEAQGFEPDAWADGVIAGKNIRLADLLAELARYRNGRIVCDERVADLRVSGLFQVRDTDRTLQFLVQTQPVSVSYRTRWWVTVGPGR